MGVRMVSYIKPLLGRTLCLVYDSAVSIFEILNHFEQGDLHFHSALGLANNSAGPEHSNKIRAIPGEQIGLVFGGQISSFQFNFSRH